MVLLEFSIAPFDKGSSVSEYVAKALRVIDDSGLDYQLTPMGTIIEGDWLKVMGVVDECFKVMLKESDRVVMQIKVDYRKDRVGRIKGKVQSVEKIIGKKLSK